MLMESGEYEWESVEEELSKSEDEHPPELVPIQQNRGAERKNQVKKRSKSVPIPSKEFESDLSSESEQEDEQDVEEMSSDALDEAIK